MSNNNKKYFIIEENRYSHVPTRFEIKYSKTFDYKTAITKMFHLNALNEDKEDKIYHLQEAMLVNTTSAYVESRKHLSNGDGARE